MTRPWSRAVVLAKLVFAPWLKSIYPDPMTTQSGSATQRRILVVEDDPTIMNLIKQALDEAGYQTATASSAAEAIHLMRSYKPNLVLTDQDMPGLTGLEMLRELRHQLNYVALIFVSGRSDAPLVAQALRAGADDYIRKPFRFEELLARVEACLRTHDLHHELLDANQKLQEMVERDHLTGLFNMRSMYDRIDGELKRAQRFGRQLACVMIDMDHFKKVNDGHDHLFGSFVLKEAGHLIQKTMRDSDFAARYGGDEFLVVLTDTDGKGAKVFCERMREKVQQHTFDDGKSQMKLTMSLGCAVSKLNQAVDARQLVRAADHALYRAKEAGRNRVELTEDPSTPP
ncbi:MAG: diguanylate cyclase [Bdellovibrionales bacterium]